MKEEEKIRIARDVKKIVKETWEHVKNNPIRVPSCFLRKVKR